MRALMIVAAMTTAAAAETPDNEVETQVLAFVARGAAVGYEHGLTPKWSAEASLGLRGAALGDYTSTTWTLGVEARWWYRTAMDGPYVGLHASAGRTSLAMSDGGDAIGHSWGFEQRVDFGWRFIIKKRLAITPSIGIGEHEDVDHAFAAGAHPVGAFACAVGFLF